ncbi:MAG: putative response regulator, CheY [Ramlibacter sp.]|nr:putative response regulator, CheY [Ramlibacter sp.]
MFRGFVVEDNAPVRAALVEGLAELAGVTTVGYAGDEQTARAWLTDAANDWDIAIVDLHLGSGGSGYRVLEAVVRRQPHQRVVVWTATADAAARHRCRALGADEVFDRATEISQLMDFCMVQSEAQARAATANSRFPPAPRSGVQTGPMAAALSAW